MPNTEPVLFTEVAEVLAAAAAPATGAELAGEPAARAAFRSAASGQVGDSWTRSVAGRLRRIAGPKAAVAAIGAFGLLGVGGAAAAAGSLPDAAQDVAHHTLSKVGLEVPRGKGLTTAPGQQKDKGQDNSDQVTGDTPAKDAGRPDDKPATPEPGGTAPTTGQGATISSIAHDPTLTGVDKGAAVSAEASNGQSNAGQQPGKPTSTSPGPPASSPSDTAPGRATASTAKPKADPPVTPGRAARP